MMFNPGNQKRIKYAFAVLAILVILSMIFAFSAGAPMY